MHTLVASEFSLKDFGMIFDFAMNLGLIFKMTFEINLWWFLRWLYVLSLGWIWNNFDIYSKQTECT